MMLLRKGRPIISIRTWMRIVDKDVMDTSVKIMLMRAELDDLKREFQEYRVEVSKQLNNRS